jgi:tetratricopeptide (TPR) repeat protein
MRLDIAAAEASYRRALELAADGPARTAVLVKLADAMQEQGRMIDAEHAYEEALPELRASGQDHAAALAMLGLARALWRHGQTARGRELTREAISILERRPRAELVLAYERAAGEDALGGRPREALAWAEKGIVLAEELGVENIVRHLQFRGMSRLQLGDMAGLGDMRDALALSLRLGLGIETATSYGNLGEMVTFFESVTAGLELVETSLDFARRRGFKHHEMWARSSRLWYLYELGQWDELLLEADELLRWDRDYGGASQIGLYALMFAAPVRAQRGSPEEAARDAAIFLPQAREVADPQTLVPAVVQAAFISALAGDLREAASLVAEYEHLGHLPQLAVPGLLPTALRVCAAAGELSLAESLVNDADARPDLPPALHSATTGRAILAEAHGRMDEAAGLYAEAAAGWGEWGSVMERAYALLGLGRCGDAEAAREGAAIFAQLRAVPFTALAA